jgi:hypothetical protein
MYTMIYEVRVGTEVRSVRARGVYRFVEDARAEIEAVKSVVAVRIFDGAGLRVYSKRIEKKA